MSFTPGPWIDDVGGLCGPNKELVMVWGLGLAHGPRTETTEANAKLIRAAPDLLLSLRHLVLLLEPMERDGSLNVPVLARLIGARAAIEKATI